MVVTRRIGAEEAAEAVVEEEEEATGDTRKGL